MTAAVVEPESIDEERREKNSRRGRGRRGEGALRYLTQAAVCTATRCAMIGPLILARFSPDGDPGAAPQPPAVRWVLDSTTTTPRQLGSPTCPYPSETAAKHGRYASANHAMPLPLALARASYRKICRPLFLTTAQRRNQDDSTPPPVCTRIRTHLVWSASHSFIDCKPPSLPCVCYFVTRVVWNRL
ncbi:hypothetical protein BC567DRAFT_84549 [Phyllosticta citribraziliensis]